MKPKHFIKRGVSLLLAFVFVFAFCPLREHFSKAGVTEVPKYRLIGGGISSKFYLDGDSFTAVRVRPKDAADAARDIYSYCIDMGVRPVYNQDKYEPGDWEKLKEKYQGKYGRLKSVIMNSFPHLSENDARTVSGMSYVSRDAMVGATQAYLWHIVHGGTLSFQKIDDPSDTSYDQTTYDKYKILLTNPRNGAEEALQQKKIGQNAPEEVTFLVAEGETPQIGNVKDAATGEWMDFANYYHYLTTLSDVPPIPLHPRATITYSASTAQVLADGSVQWTFTWSSTGENADGSKISFEREYYTVESKHTQVPIPGHESVDGNQITFVISKEDAALYYGKEVWVRTCGVQENIADYLPLLFVEGTAAGQTMLGTQPVTLYEKICRGQNIVLPSEPTVSLTVSKAWGPKATNANKQFPVEVEILKQTANGDELVKKETLNGGNGWTVTVQLPKLELGQPIVYKLHESGEADNKLVNGADSFEVSYDFTRNVITNEYVEPAPEMKTLRIEKRWGEQALQEGKTFPVSLKLLKVKGSGTELVETVELDGNNGWAVEKQVIKSENGADIVYQLQEEGEQNGELIRGSDQYKVTYLPDAGGAINEFLGTLPPPSQDIVITKEWGNDAQQYGKRVPVSVRLIRVKGTQETEVQTVELKQENHWTATVNVPTEENGTPLSYKVKEVGEDQGEWTNGADKYTVSYQGYTVKNEYVVPVPETMDITLKKEWGTLADAYGKKIPVQVQLIKIKGQNEEVVEQVTLEESSGWRKLVTVPKTENGEDLVYKIKEVGETNGKWTAGEDVYAVSYHDATVTNEYIVPMKDITVRKEWGQEAQKEGKLFDVTVDVILENGSGDVVATVALKEQDGWTKTVSVPKKYGSEEAVYRLKERGEAAGKLKNGSDEYTVSYDGFVVTNEYRKPTPPVAYQEITLVKEWGAKAQQVNKKIPVSVQLLKSDGSSEIPGDVIDLNEGNGWTKTMNVVTQENGKNYTYRITEVGEVGGVLTNGQDRYQVTYDGFKVTNEYVEPTPEKIEIRVEKEWGPEAVNAHKQIPVRVELSKMIGSAEAVLRVADLDENNGWSQTYELDKKENGTDIVYKIKEIGDNNGVLQNGADEYRVSYDGFKVRNEYVVPTPPTPEMRNITLVKEWGSKAQQEDKTFAVSVQLLKQTGSGTETVGTAELNAGNHWMETLTVPKFENGQEILYSIHETGENAGKLRNGTDEYSVSYDGFKVVNEYETPTPPVGFTEITMIKKWGAEAEAKSKKIPVQVQLLKSDGSSEIPGDIIDLNESNGWTKTMNVVTQENGKNYTYRIMEVGEVGGKLTNGQDEYSVSYDHFTVLNEYVVPTPSPEMLDITVLKEWGPEALQANKTFAASVMLMKRLPTREVLVQMTVLTESNQWMQTVTVPKYEDGKEVRYFVREVGEENGIVENIRDQYTVTYDGFKVTNEYVPTTPPNPPNPPTEMIEIVSGKYWGEEAEKQHKQFSVSARLMKETPTGEEFVQALLLWEGNGWSQRVSVPKQENGQDIVYRVQEVGEVNGRLMNQSDEYTVTYRGYDILNEYVPPTAPPNPPNPPTEMIDITVSKEWGREAIRANKEFPVVVELTKHVGGTEAVIEMVSLNRSNGWSKSFRLPKSENGTDIRYTVRENGETGGKIFNGSDEYVVRYDGYTVTNEYKVSAPPVEFAQITVSKEWGAAAQAMNKRMPVSVQLLRVTGSMETPVEVIELNEANQWKRTLNVLKSENGQWYRYRIMEVGEVNGKWRNGSDEYVVSYDGYRVVNEYVSPTVPPNPPNPPTPEMRTLTISKQWGVNADQYQKKIPVRILLKKDKGYTEEPVTDIELDEVGGWTRTLTVPKSENGSDIVYRIVEEGETNGRLIHGEDEYQVSYDGFTVTNEYEVPVNPPNPPVNPPNPPVTPDPPVTPPEDPTPYDPTPLEPQEPFVPEPWNPPAQEVPKPSDPTPPQDFGTGGEGQVPPVPTDRTPTEGEEILENIPGETVPLGDPDIALDSDQTSTTDDSEQKDPSMPKQSLEASGNVENMTDDKTPKGLPKAGEVGLLTAVAGLLVLGIGILLKKKNSTR